MIQDSRTISRDRHKEARVQKIRDTVAIRKQARLLKQGPTMSSGMSSAPGIKRFAALTDVRSRPDAYAQALNPS